MTPRALPWARSSLARPALVYVVLFASLGAFFPFFPVYLQSIGLPLELVGLLVALHASISLVAAPLWGSIADRIGAVRGLLLVAGLASAVAATVLAVVSDPLIVAIAIGSLAAASAGMIPLTDSRTVELVGADRDLYGRARAAGSAAFIVSALSTGSLVVAAGVPVAFAVYAPLMVLTGIAAWALLGDGAADRGQDARRRRRGPSLRAGLPMLFRIRGLGLFLVGSIVVWTAVAAVINFSSIHLIALGADAGIAGWLFAVGAIVEVPLMVAFPILARRFGVTTLVAAGAIAFAIRAAAWALAPDPTVALLAAPIGGIGFALFYVGTVSYIAGATPADIQATAQGIFTGTAFAAGAVAGSVIGGWFAVTFTLPGLFAASALATAIGALLVWVAIGRHSEAPNELARLAPHTLTADPIQNHRSGRTTGDAATIST